MQDTTGPDPLSPISTGTVHIFVSGDDAWSWHLSTRSGVQIARAPMIYSRRGDAKRAANAMLNAARNPRIVEPPRKRRRR